MPLVEIPCNFVGDFKVGDNLVYNCTVLCSLSELNVDGALNKMVVLQVGSILEAALIQVIYRAQNFNLEGVPNISQQDRVQIEQTRIDKFAVAIDILKKYSVLEGMGADIYEDLHELRKYRNKVHIQEDVKIQGSPRDEANLFTNALAERALRLNCELLHFLSENLARPPHIHGYVGDLIIPTAI